MTLVKVAVLVGPTAVGKTALAVELAEDLGAEIINADSMQVYRHLDIGTAKPSVADRKRVRHHLLDILEPDEPYDAARFAQEARAVIRDLHARGIRPLVVGGTGLYIKALLGGLFPQGTINQEIRARLRAEAEKYGLKVLYERLRRLDPLTARRLAPGDTYRIIRALEVVETTGRPLSAFHAAHGFRDRPFEALKIGLNLPREELYQRIEERVEIMLAAGWLEEVKGLLARYPPELKPLKAIGYRHLVAVLQGQLPLEEAVAEIKKETRRYAKRQLTWFRADPEVTWFHPGQRQEILDLLHRFFS